MCWVRHRPPVSTVSWWCSLQWVNPLHPSIRSTGQSFFSLLLCCCSSSGCNMGLLWFPNLSWWFILLSWMTSLTNGTYRSSCHGNVYIEPLRSNGFVTLYASLNKGACSRDVFRLSFVSNLSLQMKVARELHFKLNTSRLYVLCTTLLNTWGWMWRVLSLCSYQHTPLLLPPPLFLYRC
jgi:hypothetical protein